MVSLTEIFFIIFKFLLQLPNVVLKPLFIWLEVFHDLYQSHMLQGHDLGPFCQNIFALYHKLCMNREQQGCRYGKKKL